MTETVERKDIQGLVASGYDHLDYARFAFLEIIDCEGARNWLAKIANLVTNAEHPKGDKPKTCLNVALSWIGLEQFGVSNLIQDFPHEFVAGMNRRDANLILGDSAASSAENWDYGGDAGRPLHVLVLLYGQSAEELESLFHTTCGWGALNHGLEIVTVEDSFREHGDSSEPFGFRDTISQPPVRGLVGRRDQTEYPINTGEFVLGYENELGLLTRIPSIDNWEDPCGYLHDHPKYPGKRRGFGVNGTYLVFRKLNQKVDEFWAFIDERSKDPNGAVNREERERLAARMVGRWKSGAPLVLAPETPGSDPRNDFLFMSQDADGQRCPIGSHIRRANPRDSLDMPPARSIQISRRHRIIRRGRKFRMLSKGSTADKYDQGIFFIALNADLRRQFEFIQQLWINNPTFNGLDNEKDPIVGDNENGGEFTIQANPVNHHIRGLQRFVTVGGGGYFFLPGIRALNFLSNYRGGTSTPGRSSRPSRDTGLPIRAFPA
jgi:Dyp-type peroxidase family